MLQRLILLAVLFLAHFHLARAAGEESPGDGKKSAKMDQSAKDGKGDKGDKDGKDEKDGEPKISITHHSAVIGGVTVKYTVTAGWMYLKDEPKPKDESGKDDKKSDAPEPDKDGLQPKARVFYIAYTRDDLPNGAGALKKRPLTFSFNGGPGSSSVWLHLGAIGPRRVVLTDAGEAPPPPYTLVDNEASWLDQTDLVFIDPISTGYSRPVTGETADAYHDFDGDIHSVADFIRLYTSRNERWLSPKFIIGESYGTTRAAGLSDYLQERYGFYLNGIVLVSSVLNFETINFSPGNDLPYELFLPSFAAAAWYHQKLAPDLQARPLTDLLQEVSEFALHDYTTALMQGDSLPAAQKKDIAGKLARYTSLPADYLLQRHLRIEDGRFFHALQKTEGRTIGRFDTRFSGLRYEPGTEDDEFDPSFEAVNGPFTATMNDYLRSDLKIETDLPYEILTDVSPWTFKNAENQYLNVAESLRKAMTRNPYLKIWICAGYYDAATPFVGAEYTVNQMNLDPTIRGNLRMTHYEAGHMFYIHKPSLLKFKSDFTAFLQDAVTQKPVTNAGR